MIEAILQAFVASLISLVVGFGFRKRVAGTISSIGVHDSSGRLVPLTKATLLVSAVAGGSAGVATVIVSASVAQVGFLVTFVVAEGLLLLFLKLVPYKRKDGNSD